MTLKEIRLWVKKLRDEEGVNWFLGDTTPLVHKTNVMFSLYCYDDNGQRVKTVKFIEERDTGRIPLGTLEEIALARSDAGANESFLQKKPKKGAPSMREQYEIARSEWFENGRRLFLNSLHNSPSDADSSGV